MYIHHIGIITKDIEKSIKIYEKLGYQKTSDIIDDTIQYNRIMFMRSCTDSQMIELIEPTGELSSVYSFPEGYHHICYKVDTPEAFINDFKGMKIGKIFTKQLQAPALGGKNVVFAYLTNGMLVEFLL